MKPELILIFVIVFIIGYAINIFASGNYSIFGYFEYTGALIMLMGVGGTLWGLLGK